MKFSEYKRFVDGVTSKPSKDLNSLIERLIELEKQGVNPARFLTGGLGLSSETGEITEIVKKVILQGKPLDNDTKFHVKRELGDVMWYITQMCITLDMDLDEIIDENFEKLKSRYPGGFEISRSENRKEGDL